MKQSRDNFVFFWGPESPFSQWHRSVMTIDGFQYNCCEQFMMVYKAILFNDNRILAKIRCSASPKEQKRLGREVKNFDENIWNAIARNVVFRGNYFKFKSDDNLTRLILDTGDKVIVEASPYDKIWGIGLGEEHEDACDPEKWRGKNWLGEVLMKVREEIARDTEKIFQLDS